MNPIFLLLRLVDTIILNTVLIFVFVLWALFTNNYTVEQFLDKVLLIIGIPLILAPCSTFILNNTEINFNNIRNRVNIQTIKLYFFGTICACGWVDLGIYMDVANLGLSGVALKCWFLIYDVTFSGWLGKELLPKLYNYLNNLNKYP